MDLVKYLKDINEHNITNYDAETLKKKKKSEHFKGQRTL